MAQSGVSVSLRFAAPCSVVGAADAPSVDPTMLAALALWASLPSELKSLGPYFGAALLAQSCPTGA